MIRKNTKSVLLVFEDSKELAVSEAYLLHHGFKVFKSNSLQDGIDIVEKNSPNMVVLNTYDSELDIEHFSKKLKAKKVKKISLLRLLELENYLKSSLVREHIVVKPVHPTLLLNLIKNRMIHDNVTGLPSFR